MAYYNVAPRYTSGSPAMVAEDTAIRVAQEELAAHAHAQTGIYGVDAMERAEREGLDGIAYSCYEARNKMYVHDLITGIHYVVPVARWTGEHWYQRNDKAEFRVTPI
jgi:hypothetical protein